MTRTLSEISSFVAIARTREEPEQPPAALLAEVEGEEQQRGGQRDRVELPQVGCFQPRKQQIDRGKGDAGQMAAQAIARQPEDGQRAQRQDDRLQDQDGLRLLPQPVDRRQHEVDRLDVHRQPAVVGQVQLDPAPVGEVQRPAVHRVPERLVDVAQVVGVGRKRPVPGDRLPAKQADVEQNEQPDREGSDEVLPGAGCIGH